MPDPIRWTPATRLILGALANGHDHGWAIIHHTGTAQGNTYVILERLEVAGYATSKLAPSPHPRGANRRRVYTLTPAGRTLAAAIGEHRDTTTTGRPA